MTTPSLNRRWIRVEAPNKVTIGDMGFGTSGAVDNSHIVDALQYTANEIDESSPVEIDMNAYCETLRGAVRKYKENVADLTKRLSAANAENAMLRRDIEELKEGRRSEYKARMDESSVAENNISFTNDPRI